MSVLGAWSSRRAGRGLLRAGWAEPVDLTWPAVSLATTTLAFALLLDLTPPFSHLWRNLGRRAAFDPRFRQRCEEGVRRG
jgi:hypothetical protein